MQGKVKIGLPLAAINQDANAHNLWLEGFQRGKHLADGGASRKHIIDNQRALARAYLKAPAQGALAGAVGVAFHEDTAHTELASYLVGQDDAAGRWANDHLDIGWPKVFGQRAAEALCVMRPLEYLKLLPVRGAVAPGGEQKMPLQNSA